MTTSLVRCNIIGPEGSGKTTLVKKLKNYNEKSVIYPTLSTVGTYVEEICLGGKIRCLLREFGGCMAPIWHTSYEDCHLMIYIIDASNAAQLSTATVLLIETLRDKNLSNKPVLLVFNKNDVAWCSLLEMKWAMRIEDLMTKYNLLVADASCKTNEGIERIVDWIVVQAEGLNTKG